MSPRDTADSIAVVLSHRVGLGSVLPFSEALLAAGREVTVYCLDDFAEAAESVLPADVTVASIERGRLKRRNKLVATAAYGLSSLNSGANPDRAQSFGHRANTSAAARRAFFRMTKRVPPARVNAFSGSLSRPFKPVLSEREIWVISSLTHPVLAHAPEARVTTVIDSWDHPVRRTAGYLTDSVIGWNQDLSDDWRRFQGAKTAISGAPLRLRYAFDAYPVETTQDQRLMFAVGTSSHSPFWQQGELRLAELVVQAAADEGWQVVLKLKPTGGQEAWIELGERYDNVELTSTIESAGPTNYLLDAGYNAERLRELGGVQFVVNTVTTFGLDAACAGVPVLQLAGLGGEGLSGLASAQRNYHLRRYLLSSPGDVLVVDEDTVRSAIRGHIRSSSECAHRYATTLRNWMNPAGGFDEAITRATALALSAPT